MKAEYGHTIYFGATNYGPAQGGGEEARGTGRNAVLVTGSIGPGRGKLDGSGRGQGRDGGVKEGD